ncbi:MAG: hypothetical protein Q9200_002760 [Gallowayella weberi]
MPLLHYAAKFGHWPLMDTLGPTLVNQYCSHEANSDNIQIYCWNDDVPPSCRLVKPLLNEDRTSNDSNDQTVFIAIRNGHTSISERLAPHYENAPFERLVAMINTAASYGHEAIFWHLFNVLQSSSAAASDSGIPKNFVEDYAHLTPAFAAANGHMAFLKILWQEGTPVDEEVDQFGETPLSAAAANGHVHVVRFLVDRGAQLLRPKMTPLHRAAQNGHASLVHTLLELYIHATDFLTLGYALEARDLFNETPLQKAAENGHDEVLKIMLGYTSETGKRFFCSWPNIKEAMLLAAGNGHLEAVKILIVRADWSFSENPGEVFLVSAAKGNHASVIQWLLANRFFAVRSDGDYCFSAIKHAVMRGNVEAVQAFLDYDPFLIDPRILYSAASRKQNLVLETLIDAHRKAATKGSCPDTTKEMIFKARQVALSNMVSDPDAAHLLETYWKRESSLDES